MSAPEVITNGSSHNGLGDTRVLIASMFLPMSLEVDGNDESEFVGRSSMENVHNGDVLHEHTTGSFIPKRPLPCERKNSLEATAPPSIYHFRSISDLNRLPFIPTTDRISDRASKSRVRARNVRSRSFSPSKKDTALGAASEEESSEPPISWNYTPTTKGNVGLQKAVDSAKDQIKQKLWIGLPTDYPTDEISEVDKQAIRSEYLESFKCLPIFVSEHEFGSYYTDFCKQILWPTLHYILPDYPKKEIDENEAWKSYVSVNQKFADTIIETYKEGDIIWVNDYHLFLVPQMIRKILPNAVITFFLHVPFPSSEIFRCLHVRKELLEGLLGSDLIGFQTYSYARHFLQTVTRLLALDSTPKGIMMENTVVSVGIFPIGIDTRDLNERRQQAEVKKMAEMLKEKYNGKKLIVARDKLDPIKGVRQKLLAFELFLEKYPQWHKKVVLVQVVSPTTEHPELQRQISDILSRINSKFASIEYTPVVYLHQDISFYHYLALLSIADACLITSLRDGMNLTSHEYIVCQENNYGPLIISEFTGTYGSLGAAIRINPWHYREVAGAINEALTMSVEEKIRHHKELFRHVISNTGAYWAESFLNEAIKISSDMQRRFSAHIPHLKLANFETGYKDCDKRIFLFNYDGTLVPYAKIPDLTVSSERLLSILRRLVADDKNEVYIVSGRTKSALKKRLGDIPELGLCAENGCFLRPPRSDKWIDLFNNSNEAWKEKVSQIFEYYMERTPGSFIEKKEESIVWHFRLADVAFGDWQARECQNHIADSFENNFPVHAIMGEKNIEVRPKSASKKSMAHNILSQYEDMKLFILAIGDEKADEDLFEYLNQFKGEHESNTVISCTIGSKLSHANFFLTGVIDTLGSLDIISRNFAI